MMKVWFGREAVGGGGREEKKEEGEGEWNEIGRSSGNCNRA